MDYKIIPNIHLYSEIPFTTHCSVYNLPQTIYTRQIVRFTSLLSLQSLSLDNAMIESYSVDTLYTSYGLVDVVDDIIQPFLIPQSAPHLQHIPKLFFITAKGDPDALPPHFPNDPDGNYCVARHVTNSYRLYQYYGQVDTMHN